MAQRYGRYSVTVVTLAVLSGLGLGYAKGVVAAEEAIPQKLLGEVYAGCMVEVENTLGSFAKPYCTCNTNEIGQAFTLREFLVLTTDTNEAVSNKTNPVELNTDEMRKLREVSAMCMKRAIEKGIQGFTNIPQDTQR